MELSSSLNLTDFEDPINLEPLTNVVRCPHEHSHYYQLGTLPKRMQNGIEYTQCSLTNQWFISSEFKNDRYASDASIKIHEISSKYLNEKEKNKLLKKEKRELKNKSADLTNQVFNLIKQNQEFVQIIKEKEEKEIKITEEFKKIFLQQEENHQRQIDENRKIQLEMQMKHENEIAKYISIIEKQCKNFDEMVDRNKDLNKQKQENQNLSLNQHDILVKMAAAIVGVGAVVWINNHLIPKIKGLL